jgi:hypothetical protein
MVISGLPATIPVKDQALKQKVVIGDTATTSADLG